MLYHLAVRVGVKKAGNLGDYLLLRTIEARVISYAF